MRRGLFRTPQLHLCIGLMALLSTVGGCANPQIIFNYPDEAAGLNLRQVTTSAVYFESVTDMRPLDQRNGQGHFFTITYPKDEAWEDPATQIYAEALAQDLAQTQLVELVGLRAQAEYFLSADLLSLTCRLERSPAAFVISGAIGAGAGLVLGGASSHGVKLASVLAVIGMVSIPVPTDNNAEAEVRLSLKDRDGNIVWQRSCLGEFSRKKYITVTARQDQELVDEYLTKAVKRADACLLGQLAQFLLDKSQATD